MLFNVLTTTALTACALLAAPVLGSPLDTVPPGLESHLESRASDVTVKFWDSTTCKRSNSKKSYNSGRCLNVASVDHAVSMQERKKHSCHSKLQIFPRPGDYGAHAYQLFPYQ